MIERVVNNNLILNSEFIDLFKKLTSLLDQLNPQSSIDNKYLPEIMTAGEKYITSLLNISDEKNARLFLNESIGVCFPNIKFLKTHVRHPDKKIRDLIQTRISDVMSEIKLYKDDNLKLLSAHNSLSTFIGSITKLNAGSINDINLIIESSIEYLNVLFKNIDPKSLEELIPPPKTYNDPKVSLKEETESHYTSYLNSLKEKINANSKICFLDVGTYYNESCGYAVIRINGKQNNLAIPGLYGSKEDISKALLWPFGKKLNDILDNLEGFYNSASGSYSSHIDDRYPEIEKLRKLIESLKNGNFSSEDVCDDRGIYFLKIYPLN